MPDDRQANLDIIEGAVVTVAPYPVSVGSVTLGPLPAGCKVLDMKAGLFGKHALVLIATDQGLFVAECGKSRLTKLEPIGE